MNRSRLWRHATAFERAHPVFLHSLIVGAGFLTYAFDRDDIVWRFIKHHGIYTRPLEHGLFLLATTLAGLGAVLCTFGERKRLEARTKYLGQVLYAVGLAALLPLAGYVVLITGEGLRVFRLWSSNLDDPSGNLRQVLAAPGRLSVIQSARREILKWGVFLSLIVFTITLRDRVADLLICTSILTAVVVNWQTLARQAQAIFR